MKKIYLAAIIWTVLSMCITSCGNTHTADTRTATNDSIIILPKDSPIASKLTISAITMSPYKATFTVSGIVKAIPTSYAEIATPFEGRIVRSFVSLGQQVSVGSPIFEISSPAFFETGKAYFQSRQERDLALKNLNRERDLLANNVGAAKEVEQAQTEYDLRCKEYENVLSALKVFQIDPSTMTLGQPLVVRSPIGGKVVQNSIVIGGWVKQDAAPMAVVADLSKVWVVAAVKERDIAMIDELAEVEVHLSSEPERAIHGKIFHVSEMLDPDTRSAQVIVECDNSDRTLKPYMYGTVTLTMGQSEAILVPTAAILQHADSRYVLVKTGADRFEKRNIEEITSLNDGSTTVVGGGVSVGEEIVTDGAFYLIDEK